MTEQTKSLTDTRVRKEEREKEKWNEIVPNEMKKKKTNLMCALIDECMFVNVGTLD